MEFVNKNKVLLAIVGVVIAGVVIFVTLGGKGVSTASGNAKVDASKTVKSNVGDKTISGQGMALEGVSVGGNVGQIGSNTNTKNEGND